jgi:hypothetical protein
MFSEMVAAQETWNGYVSQEPASDRDVKSPNELFHQISILRNCPRLFQ